jgi:hypothetical protein
MHARSVLITLAMAALVAGCSTAGPGTSTAPGASSGGQASSGGGASRAPAASSVPDPCTLVSAADATTTFANDGGSGTYPEGTLDTHDAAEPECHYGSGGDGSLIGFVLKVCTSAMCNMNTVRDVMGGDTITGLGSDAFFQTTCDTTNFAGHNQLWSTAKGLVYHLTLDCHTAARLAQDKSEQVMKDLIKVAISHS